MTSTQGRSVRGARLREMNDPAAQANSDGVVKAQSGPVVRRDNHHFNRALARSILRTT